jgi:ABC-type siderophore export system fused ATPase/permease subunit
MITVTAITLHIITTERNYIALYIIGKDITYRDILRRSKKSLKLNLELLIEISSANLITDLKNDLTNILWIMRMTIPT